MTIESFHNGRVILHGGDCLEILKTLPENSIDAVVTDPPYHFASIVKRFGADNAAGAKGEVVHKRSSKGFMGKTWDGGQIAHDPATWAAVLRVLKPGGHMVAFHAPKNWHRQACAIEDAGFEIRDCILDLFSSGDLGQRFIDTLSHDQKQALGRLIESRDPLGDLLWSFGSGFPKSHNLKGEFEGWGSALKPAYEPICLARKTLTGTIAQCMEENGTGAINIDACRVEGELRDNIYSEGRKSVNCYGNGLGGGMSIGKTELGRWPANIVHDGSSDSVKEFPDDSSRFFYSAKAQQDDRMGSKHPTVKPIDLMRWLVRMVTPKGGTILDPFAGTGTTGQAAFIEGFNAVLIEREPEYRVDIKRRMDFLLAGDFEKIGKIVEQNTDYGPLFGSPPERGGGATG